MSAAESFDPELFRAWADSEERQDVHFPEFSRMRFESMLENGELDDATLALALRHPYTNMRKLAQSESLTVGEFREASSLITEQLIQDSEYIFETFLTENFDNQEIRDSLRGYFGELSFHLLMLRAAATRGIVTLPSTIEADVFGKKCFGLDLSYDAEVLTTTAEPQRVEIKTDEKPHPEYAARVIQPPELPLEFGGAIPDLPLNIFYDFLDIHEGSADEETIRRVNAQAAALAKTFEA